MLPLMLVIVEVNNRKDYLKLSTYLSSKQFGVNPLASKKIHTNSINPTPRTKIPPDNGIQRRKEKKGYCPDK